MWVFLGVLLATLPNDVFSSFFRATVSPISSRNMLVLRFLLSSWQPFQTMDFLNASELQYLHFLHSMCLSFASPRPLSFLSGALYKPSYYFSRYGDVSPCYPLDLHHVLLDGSSWRLRFFPRLSLVVISSPICSLS